MRWELAATGVDGRLCPGGNKFDPKLTNCVGLPEKGADPATLRPSSKYLQGVSPFDLIDMVGNAGDWVDTRRVLWGDSMPSILKGAWSSNLCPIQVNRHGEGS